MLHSVKRLNNSTVLRFVATKHIIRRIFSIDILVLSITKLGDFLKIKGEGVIADTVS